MNRRMPTGTSGGVGAGGGQLPPATRLGITGGLPHTLAEALEALRPGPGGPIREIESRKKLVKFAAGMTGSDREAPSPSGGGEEGSHE